MKFRIFYDYLEFYTHRPSGPKRSQINRKLSLIYFEIISNNVKKIQIVIKIKNNLQGGENVSVKYSEMSTHIILQTNLF